MNLLERVVGQLETLEVRFAVIGAAALAFHGASRSTIDIDLLTVDRRALDPGSWSAVEGKGVKVELRRGDLDDPLAGVVRFSASGHRPVDLIVGKAVWQRTAIERATPGSYLSVEVLIVQAADLVLLKLYAGGPQDAWDIQQLLSGKAASELIEAVEVDLVSLDEAARALWRRLVDEAGSSL